MSLFEIENLGLWILLGVAVLVIFYLITAFNRLVTYRQAVKTAWSDIDVQLQRRYDLIPNLVETAKGYMKHERELLERVTAARSGALSALQASQGGPTPQLAAAEGQLGGLMRSMMIQVEAYPELKANTNMMQLSEEITSTENKVSFSRQYYNDSVNGNNTAVESFPTNIVARLFGFKTAEFFNVENRDEVKKAPKVTF